MSSCYPVGDSASLVITILFKDSYILFARLRDDKYDRIDKKSLSEYSYPEIACGIKKATLIIGQLLEEY